MSPQWAKDADLLLDINVDGFVYDDFSRTDELIAIGEKSMRAALPALKKKLGIVDADKSVANATKTAVPEGARPGYSRLGTSLKNDSKGDACASPF